MSKRLFVGFPVALEPSLTAALKKTKINASKREMEFDWTPVENYHVTFSFLGQTALADHPDLNELLDPGRKKPRKYYLMYRACVVSGLEDARDDRGLVVLGSDGVLFEAHVSTEVQIVGVPPALLLTLMGKSHHALALGLVAAADDQQPGVRPARRATRNA